MVTHMVNPGISSWTYLRHIIYEYRISPATELRLPYFFHDFRQIEPPGEEEGAPCRSVKYQSDPRQRRRRGADTSCGTAVGSTWKDLQSAYHHDFSMRDDYAALKRI
jgi:hypothetical protein